MSTKKIYFLAPLANVDSSILNVTLERGFKIKDMPIWDYCKLISKLEKISPEAVSKDLTRNFPSLLDCSKQKIYTIENSFEIKIWTVIEPALISSSEAADFQNKLIHGYLRPTLKLMRLYKEGNIWMPFYYFYSTKNNEHHSEGSIWTSSYIAKEQEPYIIDNEEISDLQKFIKKNKLPFKYPFLQLAFENFELSYQTQNPNLAFLSLMISLETLFNSGDQELKYTISRNTAVLLGRRAKMDSETIFSDIGNLYKKRSKLVHSGENTICNNDLLKLRHYVRESIKIIVATNKDKKELLKELNETGFNEKKILND